MGVKKDFRTCDLYFAAFLKAAGTEFIESSKVGRKTYFVFENTEDMRDLRNGYFSGKTKVSALKHANEIRNLKRLIHM